MSASEARKNHSAQPRALTLAAVLAAFRHWLFDKTLLFEAFLVALSLHILLLPVIWVMGWALPWPKSPTVTTIIEYDLGNWPNPPKPPKVLDIRDPLHNQ